ncbi:MAG: hypothetical protein JXN59_19495, partial [Anaerolineae bacterium]|nr:hypothetical protein [Anaerolineae bacterium]
MDSAPELLNLFIEPSGELVYFLAVIAISQVALFMALGQRLRGKSEKAAGRYAVLLFGVLAAWIVLMGGALYTLATDARANAVMPPLERAANTLVILLAGAGLLAADSPRSERRMWLPVMLLVLGVCAAYGLTASAWYSKAATAEFNHHALGFAWTFIPGLLLICGIGLLITRYRQTADIPLKLIFFLALLAGYSYTAARMSAGSLDGDASGALRWAFLVALPMLVIVVYRLVLDRLTAAIDEVSEYAEAVSRPQPAIVPPEPPRPAAAPGFVSASESMTLLRAIGMMLEKEDPDSIPRQIVIAVANVLKADIVVLVSPEENNWADIVAAYDNIQQRHIPGLALNLDEQPTLVNALERKAQRPLFPDRNMDELVDLYTRLDVSQVGPAYIQPLIRGGEVVGALIIALPYSNRDLLENQTSLLEGLAPVAARLYVLSRAAQRARLEMEDEAIQAIVEGTSPAQVEPQTVAEARQEMQASLELAQQQIAELSRMVRDLQVELDYERSRLAELLEDGDEALSITQRIEALSKERHELSAERELLAQALQEAQATLVGATAEGDEDVFAKMIASLRHERDELEVQKNKLERQLEEIRASREAVVPAALREMLTELSEDKARLAAERDQMKTQLEDVQTQLKALGVEGGPLALAKVLGQLTEERTYYKTRAEKIAQER